MYHGNLRNTRRREQRLVGKSGAAVDKNLGLVHQIGATGLQQADHGQLLLHGDVLHAQTFAQPPGRDGAALDGAVGRRHHGAYAAHIANAANTVAPGQRAVFVVVLLVAGQGGDFQKRRAPVQQHIDPLARHQLAALVELGLLLGLAGAHFVLHGTHAGQGFEHVLPVAQKGLAMGIHLALYHGHVRTPRYIGAPGPGAQSLFGCILLDSGAAGPLVGGCGGEGVV